MSHKVNWIKVSDQEPPRDTFAPLWFYTDAGIAMGYYSPGSHRGKNKKGYISGTAFSYVMFWAEVERPKPPENVPTWKEALEEHWEDIIEGAEV